MSRIAELILGESLEALIDYRGKTPKKLGTDFAEQGVPVASALLVADGRLDLTDARFVDQKTWRAWMKAPTRAGDVLLTSEAPLGRVARVMSDDPLVLGQRLFGLRGRAGVLDNGYLYYALQTVRVQSDLAGRATGTTVSGIRQSALRGVRIPAPNIEDQRAIAEVLGALDDKIAANTSLVQTANELGATLTRSASTSASQKLSDVADLIMGSSPPGSSYNESGDGTVFYQGVRDFGVRFPANRVWTTGPVRLAAPADTLVSVRAPVGRTNLAAEPTCIGRGLAAVRSTIGHPMTLFHQLRNSPSAWAPYEAEGTVFGSISKRQLAGLSLTEIDPFQADVLEEQLGELEARIASALGESDKLADTRDELLPSLMSGKLRVKDAERVVEGVV